MMLLGIVWAALAPLSLVLLIVLLRQVLRRSGLGPALPVAVALIIVPVAALWLTDRAQFRTVCEGVGAPVVYRKVSADGIYLNSGTANSFGMRYIQDEGFAWVEAPSIYKRDAWVRYQRDTTAKNANAIATVEIDSLTARYEVRELFSQPFKHTGLSLTQVVDRSTGDILAKAGSGTFDGGRAKWVLGAWGMSSCPSAMRASQVFNDYYHLARNTLR
jgi:hypothetical protein